MCFFVLDGDEEHRLVHCDDAMRVKILHRADETVEESLRRAEAYKE